MENNEALKLTDTALLPFLNADETDTEAALADLITEQIQPTIERTLRAKLHVTLRSNDFNQTNQDALELLSEIKLQLISELGRLKSDSNGKIIYNLGGYVTSVTINSYRQFLRAKYPLRQQLRNKLRYLLTHHPKFAFWENECGEWLCGFEQNKKHETAQSLKAETIQAEIAETVNRNNLRESDKVIDLLTVIFEYSKAAIPFSELISIVAEIHGIKDRNEALDSEISSMEEKFAASEDKIQTKIEQQEHLKKVWAEVCHLPLRHRLALLLNLKDKQGDAVIFLFPLLRIASIRQIAEALEISPDEFASVWNELPWDDLKISEFMNLTRQQVINLRQSARMRLTRKLGEK